MDIYKQGYHPNIHHWSKASGKQHSRRGQATPEDNHRFFRIAIAVWRTVVMLVAVILAPVSIPVLLIRKFIALCRKPKA